MMCCSLRAAVYFLSTNHVYFGTTQVIIPIFPLIFNNIGWNFISSTFTLVFCVTYLVSGFIIFIGADKESTTFLKYGAYLLGFSIAFRFVILAFSKILITTLPEAPFLYVYNTQVVPIVFIMVVYIFYFSVVFCYHNELEDQKLRALRSSDYPELYGFKSPMLRYENRRYELTSVGVNPSSPAAITAGIDDPMNIGSGGIVGSTSFTYGIT